MWGIVVALGLDITLWALNKYLSDPAKKPDPQKFNVANTAGGSPIPLVYGTVRVDQPALVWFGSQRADDGTDFLVPYIYGIDVMFVLGVPAYNAPTRLGRVWFGDQVVFGDGNTWIADGAQADINNLQVGTIGIRGLMEFHGGSSTQNVNDVSTLAFFLAFKAGDDTTILPGYRNQIVVAIEMSGQIQETVAGVVVLTGLHIGADPVAPQFAFEIQSNGTLSPTGKDANPAYVLLDILTGPVFKLAIPSSDVDSSSFVACAATLFNEGHGYSNMIASIDDASRLIADILRQIDGVIYQDPASGLIKLRLIRHDYDPTLIPQVTIDSVVGAPQYSTTNWRQTYNQVRVTYRNRDNNYQQDSVLSQRLANLGYQSNRPRVLDIDFPGVTNATLATKLAVRELAAVSRPLAKATCVLKRDFYALVPGDAVRVNWAKYGAVNKVMRVLDIDLGTLSDRGIKVTLVEDVFDGQGTYGTVAPPSTATRLDPITKRLLMEAPRYWGLQLASANFISDPDAPLVMALATPDDAADGYECQTYSPRTAVQGINALSGNSFHTDVIKHVFPPSFTLVNNYSRILEPYDTTSNQLVITSLANWPQATYGVFETSVLGNGFTQLALVTAGGQVEIVAFDSVTNLGGSPTQYRLNGVWRALLDTVPLDHLAGERGFMISVLSFGRTSYNYNSTVKGKWLPWLISRRSSGEDTIDSLVIAARPQRAARAANQGVSGDAIVGTLGIPSVAGLNKAASFYEEGLDLIGTQRERAMALVVRGDLADDVMITPVNYSILGTVAGTIVPITAFHQAFVGQINVLGPLGGAASATGALAGACKLIDGYGSIDVGLVSIYGSAPVTGKYGINPDGSNFQSPINFNTNRIQVFAPSWRNLLANVRWNYQTGATGGSSSTQYPPAWDGYSANAGVAVITSGTFSLSLLASGRGSYFLGTSNTSCVRGQIIPLGATSPAYADPLRPSNWFPRGMTLIAAGYFRNANADANDTATIYAKAYQLFPVTEIGSASSTITPPTANWQYREVPLTLPSGTAYGGLRFDLTEVATGGTTNADTCVTELRLFVGQFASATSSLLANASFDTGTTASWTVDSGAFVVANAIASPSLDYVQGGANATNQLHQDWTIPTGFEYGTAILRFYRAQTLANDAGTVTVQVLDSLNAVLASTTTGSETMATLNNWYGRVLWVDTPDNAAKIRVIFIATRSLGSGNSGACLDDALLMFAKHIERTYMQSFTFDTPTVQPVPQTWQEYHLAYPANTIPDWVYGGAVPGLDPTIEWSDGATRAQGKLCGQFGGGLTSIAAYPFTRIASPNQVYVQPAGAAVLGPASIIGSYNINTPFTAIFFFRVDEPGFASLCGLLGRMGASLGWGANITAGGQLQAMLRGAGSTQKSVASGRVVTEGGLHMGALVYDPSAHLLYIYDEQGLGASISTASGLGDFASTPSSSDCFFRIGTDAPDHDSFPGQIGPVYLIPVALNAGQVAAHWNYAKDPTALITTYTRTNPAIVPMAADSAGATAAILTPTQVALAYNSVLAGDGGTGYGLAIGKSATNLIPDTNFGGANWIKDASTTLTQGIVGPTGRPRAVQVSGNATNGIYGQNIPLAASPTTVPLVFFAMSVSGNTSLTVELRTSTGTLESSQTVTLTALWQKFQLVLTGWAGGAANCRIRFVLGGVGVFNLSSAMCALQGTDVPAILPLPGQTHGNYNATITGAQPQQFTWEGEISAQGVSMIDSPTVTGNIVSLFGGTNANRRDLLVASGATGFQAVHYDDAGTPASVTATSAYSTYSSRVWKARNRWALCGMLDNVTLPVMSAVAWTDDTHTTITEVVGRNTAWTIGVANPNTVKIGAGGTAPSDVILRNVTLSAREEKLP